MNRAIVCGISVGAGGGVPLSLAGLATPIVSISLGCIFGSIFSLIAGRRVNTPGGGLLWGVAFALVFWLADPATIGRLGRPVPIELTPMLDNVRARFPYLVGYILFFGAPLGICLGTVRRLLTLQQVGAEKFGLSRAALARTEA